MKHVEKDDFVIHLRSFQGGIEWSGIRGKVSSAYTILRPAVDVEPQYFRWVLKCSAYTQILRTTTNQLRDGQSIKFADFARIPLPNPPIEIQRAIANFLVKAVGRIDELIARQQLLIEMLRERARALVARCVTRGLSLQGDLKESGLPWLGEVPVHWSIMQTRQVLSLKKALVGADWRSTTLLSLTTKGVIPRDVKSGRGKFPASFEEYQRVEVGDLVFCLFDIDETPRTVGQVHVSGMVTGAYTRFAVNPEVADVRFLEWYYIAIDDAKRFRPLYTGLRKVIQKPRFLSAGIALPSLEEQRSIAAFLDSRAEATSRLISKAESLIALAVERRAALITAAVTGQIDVGDVA